jgi:selenocysteine-specific elongation factor
MSSQRQIVVGTAGHIDHGKSALVRALTGIDPDRLREEKERGITIDLGFAHLSLEDGTRLGFVDVPGHERFVKNMLAGVGGIDLVLLVIAADESIKPQTREHFDICRLLRIPGGVVALTKADLVDPEILDLARLEIRDFLAGSFLEPAPIVPVSSRTGAGLDDLKRALARGAAVAPARPPSALMRLPIDRAFTIRGFGTVVTGTLIAGTIREGDEVVVLPRQARARVRGLEVHNTTATVATAGQRTAVNLQGVEVQDIVRGDVLSVPDVLEPTRLLDVELECLPDAPGPVRNLSRVRFHHGAAEILARVKLLERVDVPPGGSAFAQLRLERPTVALPEDRFILRRYSPSLTIGGGRVLHNRPAKLRAATPHGRARFVRLADSSTGAALIALVEESAAAGIDTPMLRARTGLGAEAIGRGIEPAAAAGTIVPLPSRPVRFIAGAVYGGLLSRVTGALQEFHRKEPLHRGLPREEIRTRVLADAHPEVFRCLLADLAGRGLTKQDKDLVALASHRVDFNPRESRLLGDLEQAFLEAGANPPSLQEVTARLLADPAEAAKLVHLLVARGRLVRIPDARVFHVEAIEALKRRLWEKRAVNPTIDVGEFKGLSGTSRKYAIPLLEHFDQIHVTRREGNVRVILPPPGPAGGTI